MYVKSQKIKRVVKKKKSQNTTVSRELTKQYFLPDNQDRKAVKYFLMAMLFSYLSPIAGDVEALHLMLTYTSSYSLDLTSEPQEFRNRKATPQ